MARQEPENFEIYFLAGGSGSRLWPLSGSESSKIFLKFATEETLLDATILRTEGLSANKRRIIASANHSEKLSNTMSRFKFGSEDCLLEPIAKNTAAAVALAAQYAQHQNKKSLVLILPCDHAISSTAQFTKDVSKALPLARAGDVVLFGKNPTRPDTGFGYIEAKISTANCCDNSIYSVTGFTEKPDRPTIDDYGDRDDLFWNLGIFLFRADVIKRHFLKKCPEIWHGVEEALNKAVSTNLGVTLPKNEYEGLPHIPFDTAILEKTKPLSMIRAKFDWYDLGTWKSVHEYMPKDADRNVVSGNVSIQDCDNLFLKSVDTKLIVSGLSNVSVVATPHGVLVKSLNDVRPQVSINNIKPQIIEGQDNSTTMQSWLLGDALQFWRTHGADRLGFHERLNFDGVPKNTNKRLRTMARQTWAFSQLAKYDSSIHSLVSHGLEFLTSCMNSKTKLPSLYDPDGRAIESPELLYDYATVLRAAASCLRHDPKISRELAQTVFDQLDKGFNVGSHDWFREVIGVGEIPASANSHMHLLDAAISWKQAAGDEQSQPVIERVMRYFYSELYDQDAWVVNEYPNTQSSAGNCVVWQPGHHYEWIKILGEIMPNCEKTSKIRKRLWATARTQGTNSATGLAWSEVSGSGDVVERNSRSWSTCERIRAAISLSETGDGNYRHEVETALSTLYHSHLKADRRAIWIDEVADTGAHVSTDVPASIVFHVVRALSDYTDFHKRQRIAV